MTHGDLSVEKVSVIPNVFANGEPVDFVTDVDDGTVVICERLSKQRIAEIAFDSGRKIARSMRFVGNVD